MTLYVPLLIEAVTGDTAISYSAQDYRQIIAGMVPNGQGVFRSGDLKVSQRGAGANMSVDVAAGTCFVQGGSVANQGTYLCRSDAVTNVAIAAADATNPRIDLIVAQVYDKQADGGSTYGWNVIPVKGTPAASPVAPSVPTSALLLGQVSVAANATSITTGNITDKRVLSGNGDIPNFQALGAASSGVGTSETTYLPLQTTTIGVSYDNNGNFTIQTPGRYVGVFGSRMAAASGSSIHTANVLQKRGGTIVRRFASQQISGSVTEHNCAFNFQCAAGDVLTATGQSTGAATSWDDSQNEMALNCYWIGP